MTHIHYNEVVARGFKAICLQIKTLDYSTVYTVFRKLLFLKDTMNLLTTVHITKTLLTF